jgi:hypothetical protein
MPSRRYPGESKEPCQQERALRKETNFEKILSCVGCLFFAIVNERSLPNNSTGSSFLNGGHQAKEWVIMPVD